MTWKQCVAVSLWQFVYFCVSLKVFTGGGGGAGAGGGGGRGGGGGGGMAGRGRGGGSGHWCRR